VYAFFLYFYKKEFYMDNYVKIGFDAQVPLGLERVVNDKYVQYGHGNLHPQYLNSLVEECSVHQGVKDLTLKWVEKIFLSIQKMRMK
jgi:hypothetical protein